MYKIPLLPVPDQQLMVVLEDQSCTIRVYQRGDRLYLDAALDNTPICYGAVCMPGWDIGGHKYPFSGMLFFADEQAEGEAQTPPNYVGLGSRYNLYYCTDEEAEEMMAEYFDE